MRNLLCGLFLLVGSVASAQDATFTYQGELAFQGTPVDGLCDIDVGLWDDPATGVNLDGQAVTDVAVAGGRFAVDLDFGQPVWNGDGRWLEVAVRCPAGSGNYTTLSPRQAVNSAPYAITARQLVAPAIIEGDGPHPQPALKVENTGTGPGLWVESAGSQAAQFEGSVTVNGDLSAESAEIQDLVSDGSVNFSAASTVTVSTLTLTDLDCVGCVDEANVDFTSASPVTISTLTLTDLDCVGCVDEADVDFPVFQRSALYNTWGGQGTVAGNGYLEVTASCANQLDVPLQGYCPVSVGSDVELQGTRAVNWSGNTPGAAEWSCTYKNTAPVNRLVEAWILCVDMS